jgi:hypothetical protein
MIKDPLRLHKMSEGFRGAWRIALSSVLSGLLCDINVTHLKLRNQNLTTRKHKITMAVSKSKPSSAPSFTDMSVKVGGRVFQPALPVVDGAFPTDIEKGFERSLAAFVSDHIVLEDRQGIQTRERVLDRMGALCRDWIRSVCAQKGLAPDVVEMAGGALFTSGSYRLGKRTIGSAYSLHSF